MSNRGIQDALAQITDAIDLLGEAELDPDVRQLLVQARRFLRAALEVKFGPAHTLQLRKALRLVREARTQTLARGGAPE